MIGLPTSDAVMQWLWVQQELEDIQRVERVMYRLEGKLYREACAEVGVEPALLAGSTS